MAEKVKISVPQDVVTLEVNDNGDTVVLPVSDERFIKRLFDFAHRIEEEAKKINKSNPADIVSMVDSDISFHEMLKEEFNTLFGATSYEKVFGEDTLIGAEYVLEFIDQCLPFIENHTKKRTEKFNKYNANRVGSSL